MKETIFLELGEGGVLLCSVGGDPAVEVSVFPCFPLSEPEGFFALVDGGGREIAWVESASELDGRSREALEVIVAEKLFTISVTSIRSIRSAGDIFVWEIGTRQGDRKIQTAAGTWPRPMPDGGALVEDVSGDLYRIPAPECLDPGSARILEPMIG